jgi:hypothetical protein
VASNEIDSAVNAVPGDGGLKEKCSIYQKQTDNANKVSAGVAGMCKAYKAICVEQYKALAKAVKDKAKGTDADRITALATEYERKGQQCESLTSGASEANAQSMVKSSMMGDECKTVTDDGSGKGKGGDTKTADAAKGAATKEADKKGGGIMDGMKDAMGPLGQLAQQLMKKDEAKTDDAAAATPDCSNPATAGCFQTASTAWGTQSATGATATGAASSGKFDVADTSGVQWIADLGAERAGRRRRHGQHGRRRGQRRRWRRAGRRW